MRIRGIEVGLLDPKTNLGAWEYSCPFITDSGAVRFVSVHANGVDLDPDNVWIDKNGVDVRVLRPATIISRSDWEKLCELEEV